MAKIFLDTNFFIDLIEKRADIDIKQFEGHILYVCPLSIHVLIYIYKYSIPNIHLNSLQKYFTFTSFNDFIIQKSLEGPLSDFEDNIQLHSCTQPDCDYFLTHDRKILKMKFFGKAKIVDQIT